MKTHAPLTAALIGAGLLATLPLAASAQDSVVVETITATTYVNGGVGKDEEVALHRIAKEFPLRMTFSERKDGEFLADVPVVIADARGNPVFELPKAGPDALCDAAQRQVQSERPVQGPDRVAGSHARR